MKKKALSFVLVMQCICNYANAITSDVDRISTIPFSQTYVPDDNFEQALIDLGYDDVLDDYVNTDNINTLTYLNVEALDISDLTGIEDFLALEILLAANNSITAIDISNNLALVELGLSYNQLSTIDVSNNTALTSLFVNDNLLTTIDVSNTTALTHFGIMRNQFTTIDLSALVSIEELFLHQNNITSVTFPVGSPLWKLFIYDNAMTALDVSSLSNLIDLRAYQNQLTALDVSMLTSLTNFSVNDNILTSLNVANGNNSNFNYFSSYGNPELSCIEVDDAAYATTNWTLIDTHSSFSEYCSQMTYVPDDNFEQALIDLGYDDVLDDYVITDNISTVTYLNVETLDISDLTGIEDFLALEILLAANNSITAIDISNNLALVELGLSYNQLSTIDVSNNTALTSLFVNDNLLTTIDVSNTTALTHFGIMRNQFTTIDLSALISIEELFLHQNNLTSVTFPTNSPLWKLFIYDNAMTALDVSSFTNLIDLRAYQNQLTALDVSMLTVLTNFSANDNVLTSLNVANGNNSNFNYFSSYGNPELSCINVDDAAYATTNWLNVDDTSFFSEDCASLSINDNLSVSTFKMYPNPADTYISIESNQDIEKFTIINISGQIVYQGVVTSNRIDISQLIKGLYFIRFENANFQVTKKLVLK